MAISSGVSWRSGGFPLDRHPRRRDRPGAWRPQRDFPRGHRQADPRTIPPEIVDSSALLAFVRKFRLAGHSRQAPVPPESRGYGGKSDFVRSGFSPQHLQNPVVPAAGLWLPDGLSHDPQSGPARQNRRDGRAETDTKPRRSSRFQSVIISMLIFAIKSLLS